MMYLEIHFGKRWAPWWSMLVRVLTSILKISMKESMNGSQATDVLHTAQESLPCSSFSVMFPHEGRGSIPCPHAPVPCMFLTDPPPLN